MCCITCRRRCHPPIWILPPNDLSRSVQTSFQNRTWIKKFGGVEIFIVWVESPVKISIFSPTYKSAADVLYGNKSPHWTTKVIYLRVSGHQISQSVQQTQKLRSVVCCCPYKEMVKSNQVCGVKAINEAKSLSGVAAGASPAQIKYHPAGSDCVEQCDDCCASLLWT